MKVSPILRPHVVIIGGGFGGLEAARRLARADVTITRCAQAVPVQRRIPR